MESEYMLKRRAAMMGLSVAPPPVEKKAIEKKSEKQKGADKEYKKVRKAYLAVHLKCEVKGCTHVATEIHHQRGRLAELLVDTNFFLAVCATHHRKIEDFPAWAKQEGYSISRLKITNQQK